MAMIVQELGRPSSKDVWVLHSSRHRATFRSVVHASRDAKGGAPTKTVTHAFPRLASRVLHVPS